MRRIGIGVLVSALALPAIGDSDNTERDSRPILVSIVDVVGAHFADGQDWTTEFVVVNLSGTRQSADLRFLNSSGESQAVDIKGRGRSSSWKISLPPHGSVRMETLGTSRSLTQGSVLLEPEDPLENAIGVTAIFRRSLPGIPNYEASVPFEGLFARKAHLPFDHRNGYRSGVAIVNSSPYESMTLAMECFNEDGNLIALGELTLGPLNHTAFSLTDQLPALAGQSGVMVVQVKHTHDSDSGFQLLGLRFSPSGPFSTISPMRRLQ